MSDFETIAKEFPIQRISVEEFQIKLRTEKDFLAYIENRQYIPSKVLPEWLHSPDFPCFIRFTDGRNNCWLKGGCADHDVNKLKKSLAWLGGISDSAKEWRSLPLYYVGAQTAPLNIESLI